MPSPSWIAYPPRVALAGTYPFRGLESHGAWRSESQHIIIGLQGQGVVMVEGRGLPLTAGAVVAVPWGGLVAFCADTRRGFTIASVHLVCPAWDAPDPGFPPHLPPTATPAAPPGPTIPIPLTRPGSDPHLGMLALDIATTWRQPANQTRSLQLRGLAQSLAAHLIASKGPAGSRLPQAGRVRDLLTWMEFNFRRPITRAELARRSGLGQSALSAAFRAVTGFAPIDHVIRLRLAEAQRLLRTTTMPVAEIAVAVGITDPAYFSRLYRQRFGVMPRRDRGV